MAKRPIGIIKGEGIGPEIVDAAISCLREIERIRGESFRYVWYSGPAPSTAHDLGRAYRVLRDFYSGIRKEDGVILRASLHASLLYRLREECDLLYKLVFIRPIPELANVAPIKGKVANKVDLVLVRDNSQGLYHGTETKERAESDGQRVRITATYDESKIRHVARAALAIAHRRRKVLHVLIKEDVLTELAGLWEEVIDGIHADFADVTVNWDHPDAGLADIFLAPEEFDVLLALDVDGDIISDFLSALLHGTRALTPSANINPSNRFSTYQTIHGSADDLAGRDKANPIGMIMAAALMLELSFGLVREAGLIRSAVRKILSDGFRTADVLTRQDASQHLVGTTRMTELVTEAIRKLGRRER